MKFWKPLLVFLVVFLSNIVFAQTVDVEFDPRVHFPYLKTFSWKSGTPATRPEVDKMIIAEIEKQLTSKGLTKKENGADIIVAYHASIENAAKTDAAGYSLGEWGDQKKMHEPAKIGTLVVDLVGSAKNALVWRGTAQDTVSKDLGKMNTTITQAVGEMFKDFPPGKK